MPAGIGATHVLHLFVTCRVLLLLSCVGLCLPWCVIYRVPCCVCMCCVCLQVCVQGIPWKYTWKELKELLAECGEVERSDVMTSPDGRSKVCPASICDVLLASLSTKLLQAGVVLGASSGGCKFSSRCFEGATAA